MNSVIWTFSNAETSTYSWYYGHGRPAEDLKKFIDDLCETETVFIIQVLPIRTKELGGFLHVVEALIIYK
jgi:hypothetical protein